MIKTVSFSRMSDFEKCKLSAKFKYLDKIPEPERPLPPGKTEHANDRGTRIHTGAELYVKGEGMFLPEMSHFKPEFEKIARLYQQGKVSLEGEWGFDRDWEPAGWSSAHVWLRMKLDALVFDGKHSAIVVDYKTGKRFGNEIKHNEQLLSYQLGTFLRYPDLEEVTAELWYLDQNEIASATYTRSQGLRFLKNFDRRFGAVTSAVDFPPTATIFTCRWCSYSSICPHSAKNHA